SNYGIEGPRGKEGPRGLPGPGAVPADEAVAAYISAGDSDTATAGDSRWSPRHNAPVSVRDFGAVGDGVTDDTAAIQAALDSGAPVVYAPPGVYAISDPVVVEEGTHFRGDGATLL